MKIIDLKNFNNDVCWWSKAYNLGIILRHGFNVPEWFVLCIDNLGDLRKNKSEIEKKMYGIKIKKFAIRSSGSLEDGRNFSFAGQYKSFMNVKKNKAIELIEKCFWSETSDNVNIYKKKVGLDKIKTTMSVIVQKMIEGDFSWVVFTRNPVTWKKEIIVEWCKWLWEDFVWWNKIDFTYKIQKKTVQCGQWNDKYPFLKELIVQAKKIEKIFWYPVDIEWTVKDNKIYILQIRNITTISCKESTQNGNMIHRKDYIRMFSAENRPFIFSDIYMSYYKTLNIVIHYLNNSRCTRMPKWELENTYREWKKIYWIYDTYMSFKKEILLFISQSEKYINNVVNAPLQNINIVAINKVFWYMKDFFSLYSKTEFFYTDSIWEQNNEKYYDKKIEQVKNNAREYFSRLFFWKKSYLHIFLERLWKITGISSNQLKRYSTEEISSVFLYKKKISQVILKNRKEWYMFIWEKENYFGKDAIYKITWFLWLDDLPVWKTQLVWTIASAWKIIGRVKVIKPDFNLYDNIWTNINDMEPWSVLVVESATPDLVRACEKASAIITNQWWMLSHAAIFCREFKIPCLVWLDYATNMLKDWDRVCVDCVWDTDKGIVYII